MDSLDSSFLPESILKHKQLSENGFSNVSEHTHGDLDVLHFESQAPHDAAVHEELPQTSLIPGLPYELALMCLARVPRRDHKSLRATCSSWAKLLRTSSLFDLRATLGLQEDWLYILAGSMTPGSLRIEGFDPMQSPPPCVPSFLSMHPGMQGMMWGCQVAALNSWIYVLGGSTGSPNSNPLPTVWKLCVISGQWSMTAPMLTPRCSFACGIMEGHIVVAGGWGSNRLPLRSAEMYDAVRDQWKYVADMNMSRASCQGAVLQGQLVVIGGIDKRVDGDTTTTLTLTCSEFLEVLGLSTGTNSCQSMNSEIRDDFLSTNESKSVISSRWKRVEGSWRNITLPGSLVVLSDKLLGVADIAGSLLAYSVENNVWETMYNVIPQRGFQLAVLNKGLLLLGCTGGKWLTKQTTWPASEEHPLTWDGLAPLHNDILGLATMAL